MSKLDHFQPWTRNLVASVFSIFLLTQAGCTQAPAASANSTPPQGASQTIARNDAPLVTPASNTPPPVVSDAVRQAAQFQTAFNQVAKSAEPAVVTITTQETIPAPRPGFGGGRNSPRFGGSDPFDDLFRQFFGEQGQIGPGGQGGRMVVPNAPSRPQRRMGLGSGFIIRPDGYIVTNAHVVRGADTVTVKLSDGRTFKNAKVLGSDTWTDVAVVKIPASDLPTVPLGDSDKVQVGDWAIAVGNPFALEHTVTVGVISAKGREVPLSDGAPGQYLQTDASINPGNSGGPLLDIYGRVIGVNNAIYSESGGNVGIGFAIPINTARDIADQLARNGSIRRARLGIGIADLSDRAAAFGLSPNTKGVLVEAVEPNGPAARAGLQTGDVITAFNGQPVTSPAELQRQVAATPLNTTVKIEVLRNGSRQTLESRVEELKSDTATASNNAGENNGTSTTLGVQITPLTPDIARQLGINGNVRGVVIAGVQPGSGAEEAGLRQGDVIERVGQTEVTSPEQVKSAVESILGKESGDKSDKSVALLINRRGSRQYVIVSP